MQVCSGFEPELVVGCAVVVVVRTGEGQSVAVLWIQSWAKKSGILAKVPSPAGEHWETVQCCRNCSGQAAELAQSRDLKPE